MAGLLGGLTISGSPGSFTYGVKSGYANMPVKYVSWYNAIRFANWINNGQGNADTESGAYTLLGGTATPSNGNSITRNGGASVFLPSEDEWYKAAYHQPAAAGGDSDSYWRFPTRSNAQPDSDQPPGDPSIQGNVANFWRDDGLDNGYNDGYVVGTPTFVTDVGAYVNAPSYYGTFDQGGNVWEWNESLISETFRCLRGGSYASVAAVNPDLNDLRAELRLQLNPSFGGSDAGIRLASVPEPTSLAMLALAGVTVLRRRRDTPARAQTRSGSTMSTPDRSAATASVTRTVRGVRTRAFRYTGIAHQYDANRRVFGGDVRLMLLLARSLGPADYVHAQRLRRRICQGGSSRRPLGSIARHKKTPTVTGEGQARQVGLEGTADERISSANSQIHAGIGSTAGSSPSIPDDLRVLIDAWPTLPAAVRAGITAMVKAATATP